MLSNIFFLIHIFKEHKKTKKNLNFTSKVLMRFKKGVKINWFKRNGSK